MTKICRRCNNELNKNEFNKNTKAKDGLQTYCRDCQAEHRQDLAWKKKCESSTKLSNIADAILTYVLKDECKR
ncbi:MAG: hypothetical protein ACRC5M_00730 [Anaeroplasmataceae bacterium]